MRNKNIALLALSNFLAGFTLFYSIEKIFFRSIGINDLEISYIVIVFLLVVTLFDVPTGMLADRWSRKGSLLLAMICLGISSAVMGTSTGLSQVLIGVIFWGLYFVLTSGSYQAITYDILHEIGASKSYSRIIGMQKSIFLLGLVCGSVVGGIIAELSGLKEVYFYTLLPILLNLFILSLITEPTFHKLEVSLKLKEHFTSSIRLLLSTPTLLRIALVLVSVGVIGNHLYEYIQIYLLSFTGSVLIIAILNGLFSLFAALGQFFAHRATTPFLTQLLFACGALILFSGIIQSTYAIILYMFAVLLVEVGQNRGEALLQDLTPSNIRATTLSVVSMSYGIIAAPIILIFGYISDHFSIFNALIYLGTLTLLFAFFDTLLLQKKIKINKKSPPPVTVRAIH